MGEGPAAANKPWKMRTVSVCLFVGLVCPPAAVMPLFFDLLDCKSCKNESEECEYAAGRFGDCGDDRNGVRSDQPRDQGGVELSPRRGVFTDRAIAIVHDKQVR